MERGTQKQSALIDLSKVIGIFPVCNAGAVLVHQIDYGEDRVLASLNGKDPEWCRLEEQYMELSQEEELGFCLGSFFVPLCQVMRFYGGSA
jgi:hypothetical protein